jgi:hypothetical protein
MTIAAATNHESMHYAVFCITLLLSTKYFPHLPAIHRTLYLFPKAYTTAVAGFKTRKKPAFLNGTLSLSHTNLLPCLPLKAEN